MFFEVMSWEFVIILEEEKNCFLYEKMGYKRIEVIKKLNDELYLFIIKKKGKVYKICFIFLCYFRLNI